MYKDGAEKNLIQIRANNYFLEETLKMKTESRTLLTAAINL